MKNGNTFERLWYCVFFSFFFEFLFYEIHSYYLFEWKGETTGESKLLNCNFTTFFWTHGMAKYEYEEIQFNDITKMNFGFL